MKLEMLFCLISSIMTFIMKLDCMEATKYYLVICSIQKLILIMSLYNPVTFDTIFRKIPLFIISDPELKMYSTLCWLIFTCHPSLVLSGVRAPNSLDATVSYSFFPLIADNSAIR